MSQGEFTVLAFGSAADLLGWRERRFPADGRPLAAWLGDWQRERSGLTLLTGKLQFAINQQYAPMDAIPAVGDEVALIPPVSGGDHDAPPRAAARLTREPIQLESLLSEAADSSCGAVASFLGVVRAAQRNGRDLVALEYTAYESMCLAEMSRIAEEALEEFGVARVRLVHRLGRLQIGEASVAVVTASPHRPAAFAACAALIERVKASAPIFKQEIWQDGSREWVE